MLCLCLLTQCMIQLGIMGWYQLNKAYIAANLCENRDKPAMKCCGKCYLRKQLKKTGDTDASKKQAAKNERSETIVFILPAINLTPVLPAYSTEPAVQHPGIQHLYDRGIPGAVFHPPAA